MADTPAIPLLSPQDAELLLTLASNAPLRNLAAAERARAAVERFKVFYQALYAQATRVPAPEVPAGTAAGEVLKQAAAMPLVQPDFDSEARAACATHDPADFPMELDDLLLGQPT